MIRGGFGNTGFQTFYASKEKSNCPFIPELIKACKNLKEKKIVDEKSQIFISHRYGKRVLINSEVEDFSCIKHEELIEVIDFDPFKNTLLAIGPVEPVLETPVHWMIQHARSEVNAIIQLNDSLLADELSTDYPSTKHNHSIGSIEQIKEVLKALKGSKIAIIKNHGALFVGKSLKDVEELIIKTVGELK